MLKKTINEGKIIQFKSNRTNTKNLHGTSCTFSLIIVSNLAKGMNIEKGVGLVNHFYKFDM